MLLNEKENDNLKKSHSIENEALNQLNNFSSNKSFKSYLVIKRIFDISIGAIGLLISSPVILLFTLLIRLETPGPSIFSQKRLGKGGKEFNVVKLRSMSNDAEKNGAQWAKKNDPRVTNIGKFIRKTRIDELPQFYNILKGEMTLIGPRPERPEFTAQFNMEIPGFVNRLAAKPGLTGWAQINGGYDLSPLAKFEKDMEYIDNRSWKLDLLIILKTVKIMITGSGAR